MDHKTTEIEVAKELTLKALDCGLLKVSPETLKSQEETGKAIADLFNAILKTISL